MADDRAPSPYTGIGDPAYDEGKDRLRVGPGDLMELWFDSTLLAATATTQSAWIDVSDFDRIFAVWASTGGAYQLTIEVSRDGATVDASWVVGNTATNHVTDLVHAKFARFTITNTSGVAAFTAHRTVLNAR